MLVAVVVPVVLVVVVEAEIVVEWTQNFQFLVEQVIVVEQPLVEAVEVAVVEPAEEEVELG